MNAEELYGALLKAFGPQGWWPIAPLAGRRGFDARGYHRGNYSYPKNKAQAFEIIVGAILTQNTAWKNAEKALANLHNAGLMEPKRLIDAELAVVEKCVMPSGYFRQKARRLKDLAGKIPPYERDYLLSLKGIGPETADSILLYAAKQPIFLVDAYTKRICSRTGICGGDYEAVQDWFHGNLEKSVEKYGEMHALLVELAKRNCTKNAPLCGTCPLREDCAFASKQK